MAKLTAEQFISEYKAFQKRLKNLGTDEKFADYLNKNFETKTGLAFNADNIYAIRKKLEVKTPIISGAPPSKIQRRNEVTQFVTKEIVKANRGLKYVKDLDLKTKVLNKFNLKSFANFKAETYPVLRTLDTRVDKIDKTLQSLLDTDQPLKRPLVSEIIRVTGISKDAVDDNIKKAKSYENIKEGVDLIKGRKRYPEDFYKLSFSDQLPYAIEMKKGMPRFTGMEGEVRYSSKPQNKILEFARRSWNNTKGDGPVQFFRKGSNRPITWKRGENLPWKNVKFSYEGTMHSFDELRSPERMKQYFPELYEKQKSINNLNAKMVDNPFMPGEKISNRDLIRKIQVDGYGYKPQLGTLDILHGRSGVALKPFTDLTYAASDLNKFEASLDTSFRGSKISKSDLNKTVKIIRRSIEGKTGSDLDTAITNRSFDQAKLIQNNEFRDFKTLRAAALEEARKGGPICNPFRNKGGRIGFAVGGGGCVAEVQNALDTDPVKFSQDINKTEGVLPKIKNAASKFLNVAKKGGRFGAFAAVGAAGAGLVKQFTSDDPTSYLSDENQQKNMLIDMVTEPVMDERDPGITSDAQLPVLGAVTAAGAIPGAAEYYKDRRGIRPNDKFTGPMKQGVGKIRAAASPISGLLGKGLAATGTPLGMLALEPLYIGQQLAEGDSLGEIATNPINYLGAAFAAPLTQQATKFASPAVSSVMRLGISPAMLKTVSRRFGLPGLALSAGISGYEMFDNYRKGKGLFDD